MPSLSSAQSAIVHTLDRSVFVAAGAGSGKTFTLVQRLLAALEPPQDGGRPYLESLDQALLITFTRKAASEIKGRVRRELMERGLREQALLIDTAWISTIHSMCERILRTCALELGLDPQFELASDHVADYLRAQAVKEVLSEVRDSPYFTQLFDFFGASHNAVSQTGVEQARTFGGSETAPEMAEKIARMMASAVPGTIARFERERLDMAQLLDCLMQAVDAVLGQWNPTTQKQIAQEEALRASYGELLTTMTGDSLMVDLLGPIKNLQIPNRVGKKGELKEAINWLISVQAAAVVSIEYEMTTALLQKPLLDLAKLMFDRYNQVKRRSFYLDNEDLLRLTYEALTTNPQVKRRYRGRFKLVMVDEFQDTDPLQLEIIKLLAAGPEALCYVGDAQQSIYRFRGADVGQYRIVRAEAESKGQTVELKQNFRSHDDILRFTRFMLDDTKVLSDFMDLEAHAGRPDGYKDHVSPRIMIEATLTKETNKTVKMEALRRKNAEQVAERLSELCHQGTDPSQMALLLRSKQEADIYISELRRHNIDAVMTKGSNFSSSPEVRMVLSILQALANPHDVRSGLLPLLQGPLFCLTSDDLAVLAKSGDASGLVNGIMRGAVSPEALGGYEPSPMFKRALHVLERARLRMGAQAVADTVLALATESGWLARLGDEGSGGRAQAANVMACVRRIREIVDQEGLGFASAPKIFADWLETTDTGPAPVNANWARAVNVMTIHGSKGLEFPVVAVAGCFDNTSKDASKRLLALNVDGAITLALKIESYSPNSEVRKKFNELLKEALPALESWNVPGGCTSRLRLQELEEAANAEEAARLIYVALTRAREALVVGMVARQNQKTQTYAPELAGQFLEHLYAHRGGSFNAQVRYGGSDLADLREVWLDAPKEPVQDEPAPLEDKKRTFKLYATERNAPRPHQWRMRADVRSYSSDSQALKEAEAAREDQTADEALDVDPYAVIERELEGNWATQVKRREVAAFNFGTAFHELARAAASERAYPSLERLEALRAFWQLDQAQYQRLMSAFDRWWASELRQEAYGYTQIIAERPFFQKIDGEEGYLSGSIDLYCTSGDGHALVVDYKTGERQLTAEEAYAAHQMQARYYAHVLLQEGHSTVECAFILVENNTGGAGSTDDGGSAGAPLVVRYHFDAAHIPPLGA